MPYDTALANRIRAYLEDVPHLKIEEKKMFRGLGFMVHDKMCINVSGDRLMCRFDPDRQEEVAAKPGFEPMVMKGKALQGYAYVQPAGFATDENFTWWMNLCLDFNEKAKPSKKKRK